ncbi:hypothetical protein F4803DRAFT_258956 [Xylaria telfairii]|nr:hypothetical protein F4803DRAFT_258956 [Xylaria telfairii]
MRSRARPATRVVEPVIAYCLSCLRHRPENIVIDMKPGVLVPVLSQEKEVKIRSHDSCLVVGSLGGIGCSVRCYCIVETLSCDIAIESRVVNVASKDLGRCA